MELKKSPFDSKNESRICTDTNDRSALRGVELSQVVSESEVAGCGVVEGVVLDVRGYEELVSKVPGGVEGCRVVDRPALALEATKHSPPKELPGGHEIPGQQCIQTSLEMAPMIPEYVPAEQF